MSNLLLNDKLKYTNQRIYEVGNNLAADGPRLLFSSYVRSITVLWDQELELCFVDQNRAWKEVSVTL